MFINEINEGEWPLNDNSAITKTTIGDKFVTMASNPKHPHYKFIQSALFGQNKQIYRGMDFKIMDANSIHLINPNKVKARLSANTENYYTWWIDDISNKWKKFPKRSMSFICTNNINIASEYGYVYLMIPIKQTMVGICPKGDFWISFQNDFDPNDVNGLLSRFFHAISSEKSWTVPKRPGSLEKFKYMLRVLNIRLKDNEFRETALDGMYGDTLAGFMHKSDWDIIKLLDSYYDPKANNFDLISWPSGTFKKTKSELWFNSPCYIIPVNLIPYLKDKIQVMK